MVINPPPPYIVSGPNVFTPNGDGINDNFMVTLEGYVSFSSIKIYNRYGQLLFTAKSIENLWNGDFNGRALPPGPYYWVFEGTDLYYHTKAIKGGSITLVR